MKRKRYTPPEKPHELDTLRLFSLADADVSSRDQLASGGETTQKTTQKTGEKILNLLRVSPSLSTAELAVTIGITDKGVAWQLNRLCRDGLLRRVGPDKGGHWEVVGDEKLEK